MNRRLLPVVVATFLRLAAPVSAADEPLAERFLIEGKLAEGEKALLAALEKNPKDDQARFGLGATQFLVGVERMMQAFHKRGLIVASGAIPFLRLPVPPNPHPEPIRYEDLRAIFQTWVEDMTRAEATLAKIGDSTVKLPIRFGLIRMDFDGNGRADDEEMLWKIYARFNRQIGQEAEPDAPAQSQADRAFLIAFDRGDVAWLRGYCRLLRAMVQVYLAHEARELFDHSAHLVFARPETPYAFLAVRDPDADSFNVGMISDLVATVHSLRLPVVEPQRMASALQDLREMVVLSRESWKFYLAETDDDREWIPNPKQKTVIPGVEVTDEMVKGWGEFLGETESVLEGKTLLPFWRDIGGSRGINLRRVFEEPKPLDVVYWVQGTAALPYLEEGSITKPEVWQRLQRLFGGEFIGFALWFN